MCIYLDNLFVLHAVSAFAGIRFKVAAFTADLAILASFLCLSTALVVASKSGEVWFESIALPTRSGSWCWRWGRRSWGWRSRSRSWTISDHNVCTACPHLISLFAVPSPSQDVLTWCVRHIDFVHDRELVSSLLSCELSQVTLSELSELSLKLGASWASRSCRTFVAISCCFRI
jgi:hypothetical protein